MLQVDKFYIQFHHQLMAQMPRRGGVHIYATDNMLRNTTTTLQNGKWHINIDVPYAHYVFGFRDDMTRRTPRNTKTGLEKMNFQTLRICALTVARNIALPTGGKVICKI